LNASDQVVLTLVRDQFPPPELANELINIYFTCVDPVFPILHRPKFLREWANQVQTKCAWFAAVSLAMFALASRWSNDPKVIRSDERMREDGSLNWHRAGWGFFDTAFRECPCTILCVQFDEQNHRHTSMSKSAHLPRHASRDSELRGMRTCTLYSKY
jgi:hypothetical protein